jgi:hypothetical protein
MVTQVSTLEKVKSKGRKLKMKSWKNLHSGSAMAARLFACKKRPALAAGRGA